MSTNHTANYQLSQWEPTDAVLRADFNEDNAKIDAALGVLAAASVEHTETLTRLGNCEIWSTTYVGNNQVGADNARSVTFPEKPLLAFIVASCGYAAFIPPTNGSCVILDDVGCSSTRRDHPCSFRWEGNTVSWFSKWEVNGMNERGVTYRVFALIAKG